MKEKLELVMNKMADIQYGFVDHDKNIYPDDDKDWDNTFPQYYRLQSPLRLIETKYGVCWDQVELERYYLENMGISCSSYFIVEYDGKEYPTHTFVVIEDDDKCYWFEHSWEPYRGIHEYSNLNDLLLDVKNKFSIMLRNRNVSDQDIVLYQYKKPETGLDCLEFYHHCESGEKILL